MLRTNSNISRGSAGSRESAGSISSLHNPRGSASSRGSTSKNTPTYQNITTDLATIITQNIEDPVNMIAFNYHDASLGEKKQILKYFYDKYNTEEDTKFTEFTSLLESLNDRSSRTFHGPFSPTTVTTTATLDLDSEPDLNGDTRLKNILFFSTHNSFVIDSQVYGEISDIYVNEYLPFLSFFPICIEIDVTYKKNDSGRIIAVSHLSRNFIRLRTVLESLKNFYEQELGGLKYPLVLSFDTAQVGKKENSRRIAIMNSIKTMMEEIFREYKPPQITLETRLEELMGKVILRNNVITDSSIIGSDLSTSIAYPNKDSERSGDSFFQKMRREKIIRIYPNKYKNLNRSSAIGVLTHSLKRTSAPKMPKKLKVSQSTLLGSISEESGNAPSEPSQGWLDVPEGITLDDGDLEYLNQILSDMPNDFEEPEPEPGLVAQRLEEIARRQREEALENQTRAIRRRSVPKIENPSIEDTGETSEEETEYTLSTGPTIRGSQAGKKSPQISRKPLTKEKERQLARNLGLSSENENNNTLTGGGGVRRTRKNNRFKLTNKRNKKTYGKTKRKNSQILKLNTKKKSNLKKRKQNK